MFELGNAYINQLIDDTKNKYYSDAVKIDMNNKNNTKVIIADYIKKNSVCLDVGCGVGYLGELLDKYKNAKVYGIDLDKKALEYADKRGCFERVYNFSITEYKGKGYDEFVNSGLKFDYIVFADVIEHVVDPVEILKFFCQFLNPKGKIIISLPNVAHFDIVRGLINGKFNYNHIGLLDNTHLRFYTKSSFREFIWQYNKVFNQKLMLKEIGKTIVEPEYIKDYPGMYEILNKNKEACVLQYVYELSIGNRNLVGGDVNQKNTFDELEAIVYENEKVRTEEKRLRARVMELEKGVDAIYKSKSWRMTRPLRGVSHIIKKIKRD